MSKPKKENIFRTLDRIRTKVRGNDVLAVQNVIDACTYAERVLATVVKNGGDIHPMTAEIAIKKLRGEL